MKCLLLIIFPKTRCNPAMNFREYPKGCRTPAGSFPVTGKVPHTPARTFPGTGKGCCTLATGFPENLLCTFWKQLYIVKQCSIVL